MANTTTSGNVAGELNVKFTANTAPVKEAAAEVKGELQEVGAAGQQAGAKIGEGFSAAAAVGAAAAAVVIKLIEEYKRLKREAQEFEEKRESAFSAQESHAASLASRAQQLSDYDKERSRINQELADAQQKIAEEAAKYLDTHGSITDSVGRMLGLEKTVAEVLKDQRADLERADELRSRQIQDLNTITAKQAENNNLIKQAGLTGDAINVERERARQEIEALERRRDSASGPGSYRAFGELNESIRLRKLELDEAIKTIEAEREAKNLRDMQSESERALHEARRQQAEKDREEREAQRDHEREMARLARERLHVEKEITREKNQQRGGFGINNMTFFGSRAMQSALNQRELSQLWSD